MANHGIITRDIVMAGHLRDAGHANYGKLGGATIWQHTTIPRLSAVDRPLDRTEAAKVGASRIRVWSVDGAACASLDEAIAQLNVPPVITAEEAEVLARIPDEWIKLLPFREQLGDEFGRQVGITILMLRQKGIVENELRPAEPRREPWIRRKPGAVFTTHTAATEGRTIIRAGDHVLHRPSGETWVVAWADPATDDLAWCGWPDGTARLSDCTLVKAASDAEHQQKLRELKASGGSRAAKALRLYGEPVAAEAARG